MSPTEAKDNEGSPNSDSISVSEVATFAPPGSLCSAQNLYRTEPDEYDRTSWTTEMPDDVVEPPENAESAQYAIIVRREKCYDGRKSLKVHSVIVQSALLKTVLGAVLQDYPGVTTQLDRVEFGSPFEPFVHRWAEFVGARDNVQDEETKKHVDLLFYVLEEELQDTIRQVKDLVVNGFITYDLLWTIFEPGSVIFGRGSGGERGYKLTRGETNYWGNEYDLYCIYVDFDGSVFGYRSHHISLPAFKGTLHIMSLAAFPLKFHAYEFLVRERLITRGRLWEKLKGYHFKYYKGIATGTVLEKPAKFHIQSRIIIDTEAFNTFNPDESVSVSSGIVAGLDDDQCLLSTPLLRGYSLKDKRWLEFFLHSVREIVWDEQAFDTLVLPPGQQDLKQLVLAFARSQAKRRGGFDDVIQGKGRGVIMLLGGPPGVGKTLTAESVAEVMRVPLYMMSAGDLGTSAERVEEALKDILRMVPKWGAVLLLDEADVFLEARNSSDLARNELVSIFLRMVSSSLLLTVSNISMLLSSLVFTCPFNIQTSMRSHGAISGRLSSVRLQKRKHFRIKRDKLSEARLNGRQIKNVVKIAHLLGTDQETKLRFRHVDTVLKLKVANPDTPFEWTGAAEDLYRATEIADAPEPAASTGRHEKASQARDVERPLSIQVERIETIAFLNQAVEAASKAVETTPQGHPDRLARLDNLGIWLNRRFKRIGSLDDLNRAVDIANMVVDVTPQDHPDRASRLNNLGLRLGSRFDRTGSLDDLNRAVDIANMAIDITTKVSCSWENVLRFWRTYC
ncbi:hypothetical protein QBC44DRAFT_375395 [Cladorrhinum sp. PSN332]|nr:hypothetical protein QBC44DRAFT_375395 [Cladorrhinum sp. PSN332]